MAESESFGKALRRSRQELDLSLRALSRAAMLDVGYLSKVENGHRVPTPEVAKAVDRVLHAKGELITLARIERSHRGQQALPFDPMRRRSLLTLGLGLPVLAVHGSSDETRPRKIGLADAKELEETAEWLSGLDHQHGGAALWRAAAATAQEGHALLEHGAYGDVVGKRLLNATARVQTCAGWLAFDAGRHEVARSCFTDALVLARQSGDAEVEVRVLSHLAFQCNVLGRPREAMRFVEQALRADSVAGKQARFSAIPQLRRSMAMSLSRDRAGHEKAIASARRVLDRDHDEPTAEWSSFLGSAELDGVEGTGLLQLGQPKRAERLLERAVAGYGGRYGRNRALYRVRLARARIDARAVDGAAEVATDALTDLADQVASWRVENELSAVAAGLADHSGAADVPDFLEKYAAYAENARKVKAEEQT